ncbi:SpoIIE family protein phosphatase [Geminocystis sp. NIES-3709]|uniref:SpoIIE family protein phosphatase n=1 Tax=Geminocystis sp. NIES-3709 TaxID=1617448 RepID=UPI0005FC698C|nr:SpoIIE family protein phosphatase [Geminocystis sp. NIES-3709]BAQ64174.1 serine phosphatase RsbU [Geminocystis sp. NIES-3709]
MLNSQEDKTLILIADDESLSRKSLSLILKKDGYEIIGVENGEQCLISYQQRQPDIVLLDGLMPVMDGFECCRQLKKLPHSEDIPVLMITGLDDNKSVNQAYEVGATDFLTKPINPAVLRRRIRYLLDAKKAEKALRESEEKYRSLVENLKEVIFYTDTNGVITFLNPAWKELTGLSPQESLNRDFSEYIYPSDLPRYQKGFQSLLERKNLKYYWQLRYIKKNSDIGWMEIFASLITEDDQILGISGTLNDITERKRIERYQKIERDVIKILAESDSVDEGINGVLEAIAQNLGWQKGEYWVFSKATDLIHFQNLWCSLDRENDTLIGQEKETLKTMVWNNWKFNNYENWWNSIKSVIKNLKTKENLSLKFAFPINNGEEHLGIMFFYSSHNYQNDFILLENVGMMGNQIGLFIKRKHAEEELKQRNLSLQSELNLASEYVFSLLPSPDDQLELNIEQKFIPCAKLGGDIFDYYWLDEENVVIYLLDVAGHGIHSALLSVSILNLVRSNSLYNTDPYQPWTILTELNRLFQMDEGNNYFTIWYGVYNKNTHELVYASAGHPPAILVSDSSSGYKYTKLSTPNIPIGLMEDVNFDQNLWEIKPNSILYLFSDGIYEILQENGEIWGLNNFTSLLLLIQQDQEKNLEKVIDNVQIINKSTNFDDDLSILKITFN